MNGSDFEGELAAPGLVAELRDEVRRRRMAGDLLPSFEQLLDEAFEARAPGGDPSNREASFSALLEFAEQNSHVDLEAPVRSKLPGGEMAKGALLKMMWWYLDHITRPLNRFSAATTRLLKLLDERVSELEGAAGTAGAAGSPVAADHVASLVPPFDHRLWVDLVGAKVAHAAGPVVHADCAEGGLLAAIAATNVAAYGVGARADQLDRAAIAGLDVALEYPVDHIQRLEDGALGGAVLSGFVDLLALPTHYKLVAQVRAKLRPGGVLVLLGTCPEAWIRAVPPVVSDLSPGRPLHAESWRHLLARAGFEQTEVHPAQAPDSPDTFAVVGVRAR